MSEQGSIDELYEEYLDEILSSPGSSTGYRSPSSQNNDISQIQINPENIALLEAHNAEEIEVLESSPSVRKRLRNEKNWKRNQIKRLRQEGKAYTNSSNKFVPAKQIKPIIETCRDCPFMCSAIKEEDRWAIFESYYSLDAQGKRIFLSSFTERDVPHIRRKGKVTTNSKKKFSFKYFFNIREIRFRVCKKFFLSTLDISQKPIYNVHDQKNAVSGVPRQTTQGKHHKCRVSEQIEESIRNHIARFPTVESHYCRRDSKKQYIDSSLNIQAMWRLFIEEASSEEEKAVKSHVYRRIFEREFNISFFKPKKDRCDLCEEFKVTSSSSNIILEEFKSKYETHQLQKQKSRETRQLDRTSSTPVICFDLQNVLSCPKAEVSSFFYHSKLNSYNLTAHLSTNNMVYCALWSENLMGRSGNDLASALVKILERVIKDNQHFTHLILWSDSCVPQNRNSIMSFALLNFIKTHPQIIKITLRFSVPGHSCIQEIDSVHSVIERNLRRFEYYSPISLIRILLKITYKRQKLIVMQMGPSDFKNYQVCSKTFYFKAIPFTKVCEIEFSTNILTVGFKTSFYQESYDYINLKYDKPPRKSYANKTLVPEFPIPEEEKSKNKLSEAKIKSFNAMLPFMPKVDFDFFENLISKNAT